MTATSTRDDLIKLYEYTENLFEIEEKKALEGIKDSKHKNNLIYKLYSEGTRKDKLNSLSELILKEDYLFRFAFDKLFGMLDKKFNKKNFLVLKAMKNLILNLFGLFLKKKSEYEYIPLKSFNEFIKQKKNILKVFKKKIATKENLNSEKNALLIKYFKYNFIKSRVEKFANYLQKLSSGHITILKKETYDMISELVKKTTKEVSIIFSPILINKLGDPDKKILNSVSKTLNIIINTQPESSLLICKQIGEFIDRQNQTLHAKQNGVILLSNINFKQLEDKKVCYYIMELFLGKIKEFIEFCLKDKKFLKKKILREKFGTKKIKYKNVKVPLKTLLKENMEKQTKLQNNYIRGMNKILPNIKNVSFLEDFFKENLNYFFKFCRSATSKISSKILIFLFTIFKHDFKSNLADRYLNLFYDLMSSQEIFQNKSSEQIFDLLYNIIKIDHSFTRTCALIKRLFTTVVHCDNKTIMATLIFFSKLILLKPELSKLISKKEKEIENHLKNENNMKEENTQVENNVEEEKNNVEEKKNNEEENKMEEEKVNDNEEEKKIYGTKYDPIKRNPLFANGDKSKLWELNYLKHHYNPVIRKISHLLLSLKFKDIKYKGNPLNDFNNILLLSKFSLQPLKQKKSFTKNKKVKKNIQLVNYENYKNLLNDEEDKSMQIYFDQKIKKLNYLEEKEKQKTRKIEGVDEEAEIDKFADDLFEKEMRKLEANDDDYFDEVDEENQEIEDFDNFDESDSEEEIDKEEVEKMKKKFKKSKKKPLKKKMKTH